MTDRSLADFRSFAPILTCLALAFCCETLYSQEIHYPTPDGLSPSDPLVAVDDRPVEATKPVPKSDKGESPTEPITEPQSAKTEQPADPLVRQIDTAIVISKRRFLSADHHTPWQIAHGMLALRHEFLLKKDGKKIPALEWIASGPTFRGQPWFLATRHGGKAHPFTEPMAFEGHPNQFLALFTMSDLPTTFEFQADDKTISIADMINNAKMEVNDREEITWTLWFLSHYLEPDASWTNQDGVAWSIERMVREQINKPVTKAACGGMHGLFAVAKARNAYLQSNGKLRGTWLLAHHHVQRYIEIARSMQNRDGSFSSKYYKGRGYARDVDKRISTTGHTLEFIVMALPQARINETWVRRAVKAICRDLITYRRAVLEPGGMYHAVDALRIYKERTAPTTTPATEPLVDSDPAPGEWRPTRSRETATATLIDTSSRTR